MNGDDDITLDPAQRSEMPLLANLLELYQYDLSEWFAVDVGSEGRFGYSRLPLYWSEGEHRFPFLVRSHGIVVGFVFATLGSPASDDPTVYDVAEFFILRRYRRTGIGKEAAFLLWKRFPGRWYIRVLQRNAAALKFWRAAIVEYGVTDMRERSLEQIAGWSVFSFVSAE